MSDDDATRAHGGRPLRGEQITVPTPGMTSYQAASVPGVDPRTNPDGAPWDALAAAMREAIMMAPISVDERKAAIGKANELIALLAHVCARGGHGPSADSC